uniref:Uncharacterized protein n=1 Tax=Arundo donax TaxID=35708 RepID=A0A0A8Y730_ARUDO
MPSERCHANLNVSP